MKRFTENGMDASGPSGARCRLVTKATPCQLRSALVLPSDSFRLHTADPETGEIRLAASITTPKRPAQGARLPHAAAACASACCPRSRGQHATQSRNTDISNRGLAIDAGINRGAGRV